MVTSARNHHHSSSKSDYAISKGTRFLLLWSNIAQNNNSNQREICFNSPLLRIQSMMDWLYVFGQKIMVVMLCARGSSLHGGRQEVERRE